jgi:hypothetical protein
MYKCTQKDVKKALSEINDIKKEVYDLPKDGEKVSCKSLLEANEYTLVGSTTFFAIQTESGDVFLVKPHDMIPASAKIVRTTKGEPVRQKAQSSG